MPVAKPLDPHAEANLMKHLQRASAAKARAFALAAIRETFEETGLLLGVPTNETVKVPPGPWSGFAEAKILPDLSVLRFIGRAITPPGRPRRFDARFFTLDASAIAHRVEGVTGPDAELVELVWMPLTDAKQLDMPAVTGVMLEELDARIADGFGHDLPVPFYSMPRGASNGTCCDAARPPSPHIDIGRQGIRFRASSSRSRFAMAKATTIKVKLVSSADTGFYYVTRKNSRTMTDKLVKKKYDPVAKKHVEFRESKIK